MPESTDTTVTLHMLMRVRLRVAYVCARARVRAAGHDHLAVGGLIAFANWRYRTCPPNELLVVYGIGGHAIKRGGGVFVLPIVQQSKTL